MADARSRLVSLRGIHNAALELPKAAAAATKPLARGAPDEAPRPVKVRRLDGREDEIDPSAGTTWVMPRMSHPEKLVSNKAEALRRFAERRAREGRRDPEVERRAAEAAAEAEAKRKAQEDARRAAAAARPNWRNVGPGRVVSLSGAEPTRSSPAAPPAAGPRLVRLGSAPPPARGEAGARPRAPEGGQKPVLSRLAQPAGGAALPATDARAILAGKR